MTQYVASTQISGLGFECIFTHTSLQKSQLDLQYTTELKQAWNKGESYLTERQTKDWEMFAESKIHQFNFNLNPVLWQSNNGTFRGCLSSVVFYTSVRISLLTSLVLKVRCALEPNLTVRNTWETQEALKPLSYFHMLTPYLWRAILQTPYMKSPMTNWSAFLNWSH